MKRLCPEGVEYYNGPVFSGHKGRAATPVNSQQLCQRGQGVHKLQPDKDSSMEAGRSAQIPASVFCKSVTPGLGDHTPMQVSHPRVHGLHKLNLMGLKKQKRRTGSYVGRDVGWFWEELGGRGSYDKNIPYKIFKGLRIFKKNISESVVNDWGRGWPLGQQC